MEPRARTSAAAARLGNLLLMMVAAATAAAHGSMQQGVAQPADMAKKVAGLCVQAIREGINSPASNCAALQCCPLIQESEFRHIAREAAAARRHRISTIAGSIGKYQAQLGPGDLLTLNSCLATAAKLKSPTSELVSDLALAARRFGTGPCATDVALQLIALTRRVARTLAAPSRVNLIRLICDLAEQTESLESALDFYANALREVHEIHGDGEEFSAVLRHAMLNLITRCDIAGCPPEQRGQVAFLSFVLEPDDKGNGRGDIYARPWLVSLRAQLRTASINHIAADLAWNMEMFQGDALSVARTVTGSDLSAPLVKYQHSRVCDEIVKGTGWPRDICLILAHYAGGGWTMPSLLEDGIESLKTPPQRVDHVVRRSKRARPEVSSAS